MSHQPGTRELKHVLRQFFSLLVPDQLVGYQLIRERLAESLGPKTDYDRELAERAESLEALATVAEHLRLAAGRAPTVAQFDRVSGELELGWSSARVGRLWGRWRFAKDAFEGGRSRLPQRRIEAYRISHARPYTEEDCLSALQSWLAGKPSHVTVHSYAHWHMLHNEQLRPGESPVPGVSTLKVFLQVGFREAVRVARGELSLADARDIEAARRRLERLDWSRTEHQFVGVDWISRRLGVPRERARTISVRTGFPEPVVRFERRRAWLEEDLDAYLAGEPLPDLDRSGLQELYLSAAAAAALVGRDRSTLLKGFESLPKPAGMVSFRSFFLRSEVEQWIQDNPTKVGPGGHLRHRHRPRRPHEGS